MALTAYFPLEQVYKFHQQAEWWVLRRYASATTVTPSGERLRPAYVEQAVEVFRDPRGKGVQQADAGQAEADSCTVYMTVRIHTVDHTAGPQQTDVLFASDGTAWQATNLADWTDAKGCVTTLTRSGRRDTAPWA